MKKIGMTGIILTMMLGKGIAGVIMTGIIHGTLSGGMPKAIELFITGQEDLAFYQVWRSTNGAAFGSGSGSVAFLYGNYSNTFVYLVKPDNVEAFHNVFGDTGIYAHVIPLSIINGNGNDGFQIRLIAGSVVIDQVWLEDATYSYRDSYWYRMHGTGPDGGWLVSNWSSPGNDALDGLDEAGIRAAVPFGTYAVKWKGINTDWNDMVNWTSDFIPSWQTNVFVPCSVSQFPIISNSPANPATCMNMEIDSGAIVTVEEGKAMTVHGNLMFLNSGNPATQDPLLLTADSSDVPTGSFLLFGQSNGPVNVERFIEKDNKWHFLSSPVGSQLLQPEFVPDPVDQSFDFYSWDESLPPDEAWINIRDSNGQLNQQFDTAFMKGKGYLVAYATSNSGDLIRSFNGLVNTADQNLWLNHSCNYWNLLGNPYTCALDWSSDGINKSKIAGTAMYIWDPQLNGGTGGYRTHNGSAGVPMGTTPYIPAMQGFFVQSLDTGFLTINSQTGQALIHSSQTFYKELAEITPDRLRVKVTCGNFSDEILIYIDPSASNQFEPVSDVIKLFNGREDQPEIYTTAADEHKLCINILSGIPVSIPMGIIAMTEDSLTLEVFDFDEMDPAIGIYLEDLQNDAFQDMRENPAYQFIINPFQSGERFLLHLISTNEIAEDRNAGELHFSCRGNSVFILNESDAQAVCRIYSSDGRMVWSANLNERYSADCQDLAPGIYLISILSPSGNLTEKIFIH